jgi:hypothetical protein
MSSQRPMSCDRCIAETRSSGDRELQLLRTASVFVYVSLWLIRRVFLALLAFVRGCVQNRSRISLGRSINQ